MSRGNVARGAVAIGAAAPVVLAWRFATLYRARAGYPARRPVTLTPSDLGLEAEEISIPSPSGPLPGWFVRARATASAGGSASAPCVVIVHGWESNRSRVLPNAAFLSAAGFHSIVFDVRAHGESPEERLPVTLREYADDALSALLVAIDRPDVRGVALLGHSFGAAGAIIAAAEEPRVRALVSTAAPADPHALTRRTFLLAHLPIPGPVAVPLSWISLRALIRPRHLSVAQVSPLRAIGRFAGPILLVHGERDETIPVEHLAMLRRAASVSRAHDPRLGRVETLVIAGAGHRWLYEHESYRAMIARFLASAFDGAIDPDQAAEAAAAAAVRRPPEPASSPKTVIRG